MKRCLVSLLNELCQQQRPHFPRPNFDWQRECNRFLYRWSIIPHQAFYLTKNLLYRISKSNNALKRSFLPLPESHPSTHLWNPESTADVHPLGAAPGGLHGAALLGAQEALGLDAQRAGPAQPAALGHLQDPVTRLHPRGQQRQGEQSKHQVVS